MLLYLVTLEGTGPLYYSTLQRNMAFPHLSSDAQKAHMLQVAKYYIPHKHTINVATILSPTNLSWDGWKVISTSYYSI